MSMFRRLAMLFVLFLLPLITGCTPWDGPADEPPPGPDDAVVASAVQPAERGSGPLAPVRAGAAALSAEAIPGFGAIAAGTPGTLDVLVRLEGANLPGMERPPLDLALVVDQSGSMAGEKLQAVKQAALDVVKRLEPTDRVTLIAYESDVHVHTERLLADAAGKTRLRRHILGIRDMGSTALGPALFRALDILQREEKRDPDVLAHVMLLSDGLANEGESRPDVIAARAADAFRNGIATSTLGVGLDYNEDLMTRVADQGGGRYHFIENGADVPRVLGDEFAGLVSTVASNIELQIAPAEGVVVERVFGYATDSDKGLATARIGALSAKQKREILVRLTHGPAKPPRMALGRFTISFRDARDGQDDRVVLLPAVEVTRDPGAAAASERTEVTVRVAELLAAEQLKIATDAVEGGRYEDAKDVLRGTVNSLRQQAAETPSDELDAQILEMEEAIEEVDDARQSEQSRKLYKKKHKSRVYMKGKK